MASSSTTLVLLTALSALGSSGVGGGVPSFTSLDANGDGQVSVSEASVRHGLRELMREYDRNGDGGLERGEYERLLKDALRETRRLSTGHETTQ